MSRAISSEPEVTEVFAPGESSSLGVVADPVLPDAPDAQEPVAVPPQTANPPAPTPKDETAAQKLERERAEAQVNKQEKQRVMGVVPNFNIVYDQNAPPLRPGQKIRLAFHSSTDPFAFVAAALVAGIAQAQNSFPGYGQGAEGYAKRFGASYADNFDGTMIGNAFLPILFKEDPRYFRRGTGSVKSRFWYAVSTTVWCKRDNGGWGPNYANVLGNLAAGGISNIYYPASDRGAGLTFERGLTVTAEGTIGGLANEFLPDLTRHFLHREVSGKKVPDGAPTPAPATTKP